MGKSAVRIEYLIKNEIETAQLTMKELEKLAFLYQSKPAEYPEIHQKEKERRIQQVQEVKLKIDASLKQAKDAVGIKSSQKVDLEQQPLMPVNTMDGKGNVEVLQMHNRMIRDQDDQLDEVVGIVQVMKGENQNFQTEVNLQTRMLQGVNQRVEKTTRKLEKLDDRLKGMIARKPNSFYYVIILIEVALILLLLFI